MLINQSFKSVIMLMMIVLAVTKTCTIFKSKINYICVIFTVHNTCTIFRIASLPLAVSFDPLPDQKCS